MDQAVQIHQQVRPVQLGPEMCEEPAHFCIYSTKNLCPGQSGDAGAHPTPMSWAEWRCWCPPHTYVLGRVEMLVPTPHLCPGQSGDAGAHPTPMSWAEWRCWCPPHTYVLGRVEMLVPTPHLCPGQSGDAGAHPTPMSWAEWRCWSPPPHSHKMGRWD